MATLSIRTAVEVEYNVFDKSGTLPFTVLIGLCRTSSDDLDPRPVIVDTRKTLLDVPYALAHGLLQLEARPDADAEEDRAETLRALAAESDPDRAGVVEASCVTLPSPVGREEGWSWRRNMTVHRYRVEKDSPLASMLQVRKKYAIRIPPSARLGVGRSVSNDGAEDLARNGSSVVPLSGGSGTECVELLCRRSLYSRFFCVVPSLPWPPRLITMLELVRPASTTITTTSEGSEEEEEEWVVVEAEDASPSTEPPKPDRTAVYLDVTTTHTGSDPISVQIRGHPRFLYAETIWGMESHYNCWGRIIDPEVKYHESSLRIVDRATGMVVRCPPPRIERGGSAPGGCGRGVKGKPDYRPLLCNMVTLAPGRPWRNRVEISRALAGLPDGQYGVGLEPRGMWWCWGDPYAHFATIINGEDERVPWQLWREEIPPAVLASEEVAWFRIEQGEVVPED